MNIAIVGAGYVGLVTACCLAAAGHRVKSLDQDGKKTGLLQRGRVPFHEPGLAPLLQAGLERGNLTFHHDDPAVVGETRPDLVFLAVGTPPDPSGTPDLTALHQCANGLKAYLQAPTIVVIKSTVLPGTGALIEARLNNGQDPGDSAYIHVVSNPEFLSEGRAVHDFQHPDRIVVGTDDARCRQALAALYQPFSQDGARLMFMDRCSAEFAKYACNAMLAARVSMINELAGLASVANARIEDVCEVLKSDPRIGAHYLDPGIGYGGSCLPKDVQALINLAERHHEPVTMLRSVQQVNHDQGERLLHALRQHFGGLSGRHIAVWGVSFKPDTDDVRASPSITLIRRLHNEGATVHAYDPVAQANARHALSDLEVPFGASALDACDGADALVVMTAWAEFVQADLSAVARRLKGRLVVDARHLYHTGRLARHGLQHLRPADAHRVLTAPPSAPSVAAQNNGKFVQGPVRGSRGAASQDGARPERYPDTWSPDHPPARA